MFKTALILAVLLTSGGSAQDEGYWFYVEPEPTAGEKYAAPAMPASETLMTWHPDDIEALLAEHLDYAVYVQTPESVANYYRVQDVARRKARSFTALTKKVMLDNPVLNARLEMPVTNAGQRSARAMRNDTMDTRLKQESNNFALIMFSLEGCAFCDTQMAVLKHFQSTYGWRIGTIDIKKHPDKAARFAIEQAPVTIIIRKGTEEWQTVAVGAESLPIVRDNTYRAIRFLRGEISPEQFLNAAYEDGGFFDPAALTTSLEQEE